MKEITDGLHGEEPAKVLVCRLLQRIRVLLGRMSMAPF